MFEGMELRWIYVESIGFQLGGVVVFSVGIALSCGGKVWVLSLVVLFCFGIKCFDLRCFCCLLFAFTGGDVPSEPP